MTAAQLSPELLQPLAVASQQPGGDGKAATVASSLLRATSWSVARQLLACKTTFRGRGEAHETRCALPDASGVRPVLPA